MGHLARAALALRGRRRDHPPRTAHRGPRRRGRGPRPRTRAGSTRRRRRASGGNSAATYYACLLLVEFGALATFFARDAILFFVAFEVVLVPMWVLISRFGDDHATERARADASNRFVLFTALGSTLMLLGILVLVVQSGTSDLGLLAAAHGAGLSAPTQVLVATLLVIGLGIKVPLWPVHTWLPPAHTIAPTAGSVLLAAVLLKMGTYGIIRLAIPTVPEGFHVVAPFLAASGAIGILWGGLACLVERDLKRLVAYSSVAHMGFVALGLASGTQTGMQAALFGNVAHGLVSALLFFVVGGLKERWGSADLTVARDALRDVSPRMGFALVVGFASALGLPGLVGFWGEFLARVRGVDPGRGSPRPAVPDLRGGRRGRDVTGRGLLAPRAPPRLGGPPELDRTGRPGSTPLPPRRRARRRAARGAGARRARDRPRRRPEAAARRHRDRRDRPRPSQQPGRVGDLGRRRHHRGGDRAVITFDVGTLLPALSPLIGAVVVLVLDVLDTRGQRVHYAVAFIALVIGMFGTFGALGAPSGDELRTLCLPNGGACFYSATALSTTLQLAALLAAAVTLLLAWPSERADETGRTAVTVSLLLAATGGAVGVAGARDLASWLVTLELATLPVVALAALPGTRRALAGAVQLVTTSLVSFAMLALGAACWYAATGSPELGPGPALAATSTPQRGLLALAVVLVLGGIAFKLSLVPFHAWTPTTYAGSPLPITVFLAGVSKVAALAALLVVVQAVTQLGRSALIAVARSRDRQHDARQPHGPAPERRRPAAGLVDGRAGRLGRGPAAVGLVVRGRGPPRATCSPTSSPPWSPSPR